MNIDKTKKNGWYICTYIMHLYINVYRQMDIYIFFKWAFIA